MEVTNDSLNHSLKGGLGKQTCLEADISPNTVFPLPLVKQNKLPKRGRSYEQMKSRTLYLNFIIKGSLEVLTSDYTESCR